MQFLLILAVVAAISISESAPREPLSGADWWLAWSLGCMLLVPLVAMAGALFLARRIRREPARREEWLVAFDRFQNFHVPLWLGASAVVLYGLGWPQLIRFNWGLEHSFLADDLLILSPVILPLVLSWAAFYEVDRALESSGADSCAARLPNARTRYVALRARHYLALLLTPVLGVLAVDDGARLLAPGFVESEAAPLIFLPPLLLMIVALPLLLRFVWRTEPLPSGPLRDRLESVARQWNFHPREILIWNTDRTVVNAAVAGFLPQLRYVLLSDALLQRFSDEEVEAVFTHEVGHIRHRHLSQRAMVMLSPVLAWLVIKAALPSSLEQLSGQLVQLGLSSTAQPALLGPLALGVFALLVFGPYSRRLELEADLFACYGADPTGQLTPRGVGCFVSALEKLAAGSGGRRRFAWLHPTIHERVQFLSAAAPDGVKALPFQRRLRNFGRLLAAGVLSAIGYLLLVGSGIS